MHITFTPKPRTLPKKKKKKDKKECFSVIQVAHIQTTSL